MLLERESGAIGDTTQNAVEAWRETPSPARRALIRYMEAAHAPARVGWYPRSGGTAGAAACSHQPIHHQRPRRQAMFDMCTVLAKRAERQAEVRALKAAIQARRAKAVGQP